MKITGPGPIRSEPGRIRKKDSAKGAGFARQLDGSPAEQNAPVSGPQHVAAVDALLALQEVPDAGQRPSAGLKRAGDLLDRLDEIRVGLLDGAIPRERLGQLVKTVRARREAVEDPRLATLLDEIELRARVELAKLGQLP